MRMLLCCVLGALCFGRFPAVAQNTPPPFTATITAESPAVNIGPDRYTIQDSSKVFVTVHITNTSKTNLSFGYDQDSRTGICSGHQYEVRGGDGTAVPMRPIQHPEVGSTGHGWPARVLKPGESMDIPGDYISHAYDLSRPGEYTMQLSRAIGDDPKHGFVKSNIIALTVAK